jgi:ectoine hydroxylase-related dioxygenase (phytanoyl-CoA dioxygenase family)
LTACQTIINEEKNTMAKVQTVQPDEKVEVISRILERDGCIVIENVLDKLGLDRLKGELGPHFEETPNCTGDFYGHATKRLSSLIAKSTLCRQMAIHPVILAAMDEFLLKGCRQYQLNLTQAIRIGPGEPQQIMHPDDPLFPYVHPGYEAMINCMWAVDEFTAENGATNIVPGSHKWARIGLIPEREPLQDEITQGVMPAGSVLIYFGSLLHCGGANRSAKPRTGVVLSYCQGWLRQSENQYLAVPLAVAKTLPERLQRLLGYFVHEPNLGQIEGRDPIELLQGKHIVNAGFEEFLPSELQPLLDQHKARLKEAA